MMNTTSTTNHNNDIDGDNKEVRHALQYAVMQICSKEEEDSLSSMTPQAITALTELTHLYATTVLAQDLDSFSSHANRKSISPDDVKLVARKSQEIRQKLGAFCNENIPSNSSNKSKKRNSSLGGRKKAGSGSKNKAAVAAGTKNGCNKAAAKSAGQNEKENRDTQNNMNIQYDMPSDSDSLESMLDLQSGTQHNQKGHPNRPSTSFKRDDSVSSFGSNSFSENEFETTISKRPGTGVASNKKTSIIALEHSDDDSDDDESGDGSSGGIRKQQSTVNGGNGLEEKQPVDRSSDRVKPDELADVFSNAALAMSSDDDDD